MTIPTAEAQIPVTRQGVTPSWKSARKTRSGICCDRWSMCAPDPQTATVGNALRYVLLRSGYLLCPAKDIAPIFTPITCATSFHVRFNSSRSRIA
ncbi:MAG: hypothetical protein LBO00_07115 [Zoogloeaceae bacterium]|nr:hypothetical protein [Zoogloeaceae bacterium]